jgi:hypothetical protein
MILSATSPVSSQNGQEVIDRITKIGEMHQEPEDLLVSRARRLIFAICTAIPKFG